MADSVKNFDVEITDLMIMEVEGKRYYFGHQSVGFNILDGVSNIIPDLEIIVADETPGTSFVIAHSQVGENTDPQSKIDEFTSNIENSFGDSVDYAFLKFCYVDIKHDTEVQSLFYEYKNKMAKLEKEFPNIQIVHFTIPLTTIKKGPKAFLKKILGRPVWGIEDNIKREEFNNYLRSEYPSNILFDIAEIESTRMNGSRESREVDGKLFYSLVPDYTDDGGHLNEIGKKLVAAKFIKFLSEISTY